MSAERYQELLSELVDGDLSPSQTDEFAELLTQDPVRVQKAKSELAFVDLLEQSLNPERSFSAFLDGLETRVRAQETSEEFIAELIPKLKEADDKINGSKIITFPGSRKIAWSAGIAAAAAIIVAVYVAPDFFNSSESNQPLVATDAMEWESGDSERPESTLAANPTHKLPMLDGQSATNNYGSVVIGSSEPGPTVVVEKETSLEPGQQITMDQTPGEGGAREVPSDGMRSYLIQLDGDESEQDSNEFVVRSITFDDPIEGLTVQGLEMADKIEIDKDGHTLQLKLKTGERTGFGQMRVFVREDPDKPKGTVGSQDQD
tara:strand:+ start:14976 stop:15929 length:954 start_codon:yes stop_codon:yes gene_type:complete